MKEPRGKKLVARYVKNYGIAAHTEISEQMVLAHWQLEKALAKELLNSAPENRWEIFERCYSTLYRELWWLNKFVCSGCTSDSSQRYRMWLDLVGEPPKRIYEVGSGRGELITYLAGLGFNCKASEVTRERGQKHAEEHPNLCWVMSDGVHFQKFEAANSCHVVISNQLIEHLHPDDVRDHFEGVLYILSNGGKYIFTTPHRFGGPSDISRVFKRDTPMGMHLKEYTYKELKNLLEKVGFRVFAVFRIPGKVARILRTSTKPRASRAYLSYLCVVETLVSLLPSQRLKRIATTISRLLLFSPGIFIVAQKR
jgi:SAM-dependent methyltransferase